MPTTEPTQNEGLWKKRTPRTIRESWDHEYQTNAMTNWELLPLNDQLMFVQRQLADLESIHDIIEIGCGRGYRTLAMLLGERRLNRPDVNVFAIDISSRAITDAREVSAVYQSHPFAPSPLDSLHELDTRTLECRLNFEVTDVLELPDRVRGRQYDLVVDWMCFHDLPPDLRVAYAAVVQKLCRRWFVLNVFSTERAKVVKNPGHALPGILKYAFSDYDIQTLFPGFDIVSKADTCDENVDPHPAHSDGPIFAKRAYLLRCR